MTLPDTDTLNALGGALVNAEPVLDATTDLDADADNKSRANVAMMTHTATRAMRRFKGHATTPSDPTSGFVHDAVWGNLNASKPAPTHSATGIYLLTWPTSVQDELGVSHAVNLRTARAWVEVTGSTLYVAAARVTAPNIIEVRVFTGGALDDAVGLHIVVEAK